MKIGYVSQPLDNAGPPDPGGSLGIWTWEVARRLARSAEVLVCAPRKRNQPSAERWEGVQFVRTSLAADLRLSVLLRRAPVLRKAQRFAFASSLHYFFYAFRTAKALRAHACDIVHIHNFSQFVPIVRLLNPKARIVLHMNCDWLAQLNRNVIERRLRHTDAIIGCSEYVTTNVRTRFPHYADRCMTVYNGVDTDAFSPGGDRSATTSDERAIYMGRVSPEKGLHVLLDAFREVLRHRPNARLEIVGGDFVPPIEFIVELSDDPMVRALSRFYKGSYLSQLRDQAGPILDKNVSFTGPLPHPELTKHLRNADVFVHPAVWPEPFPLAVLEATATALPVVASRVGGLPELVEDGTTGLLVEPDDPWAIAYAVARLLDDRSLAKEMGRSGRLRAVRMFSWDVVADVVKSRYSMVSSTQRRITSSAIDKRAA